MFRRKSSSHGALPHPGHGAATISSGLARGCRRTRLQIYIWWDTVSEPYRLTVQLRTPGQTCESVY